MATVLEAGKDDAYKAFRKGLYHFDRGEWDLVIEEMTEARVHLADAGTKVPYNYVDVFWYFPGLYIGLAACECEEKLLDEALEKWPQLLTAEGETELSSPPIHLYEAHKACSKIRKSKCRDHCDTLVQRYLALSRSATRGSPDSSALRGTKGR